ncbi:plexin-B1-like [Notechis scutatus]|uniref:Plexin-B1-like n=1 Tax=Notechis scutatus TaxID=8663 RepID=A0A6J1VDZ2_9SAUR|nr:plexin-B1-like [Notechis scutatus]
MTHDNITIQLEVRFHDIFIASTTFSFYDCSAVASLRRFAPCQGCVSSHWGCNWCVHQHLCTHKSVCENGPIIYNRKTQILDSSPFPSSATPSTTQSSLPVVATEPPKVSETPGTTSTPVPTIIPIIYTSLPATSALTTSKLETLTSTEAPLSTPSIVTLLETTRDSLTLPPTEVPTTATLGPTSEYLSSSQLEILSSTVHPTSEPATDPEDGSTDSSTAMYSTPQPVLEGRTPFLEAGSSSTPSSAPTSSPLNPLTPNQTGSPSASTNVPPMDLETEPPILELPYPTDLPKWLPPEDIVESQESEEWMVSLPPENDTSSFSASILLSGDGDSSESDISDFPRILNPLDYQYDAPGFLDLTEEYSWGPEACPCVTSIQGSSLMPVNVQRKITLIGKNFHLYQARRWQRVSWGVCEKVL